MEMFSKSISFKNSFSIVVFVFLILAGFLPACNNDSKDKLVNELDTIDMPLDGVVNGIDTLSGLAYDEHFEIVRANCITCHSAKLITQNRATREGWKGMLDWMKETQNLHDLGENEGPILDYLAKHYAPENKGRRAILEGVEWYVLDEE